ncbi:hypothetical protein SGFS_035290 [Streptomyces graminofaciens]|uniref:Uncharacterized protein n=1 Tax=Streptomyces graminofaciens TaxID=68212 RepID=A0ABN5VGK3_9ACTN|nr:hypothetical protein SGFS_035290 [Streptomyces graminofaciens]
MTQPDGTDPHGRAAEARQVTEYDFAAAIHGPVRAVYLIRERAKIYARRSRHWVVAWLWFLS